MFIWQLLKPEQLAKIIQYQYDVYGENILKSFEELEPVVIEEGLEEELEQDHLEETAHFMQETPKHQERIG